MTVAPKSSPAQTLKLAQALEIAEAALEPWPLEPDSIIGGSPNASGMVLSRATDGRAARGVWACSPGEFRWTWTYDETLVVVAGEATVELSDGQIELKPGSMAFFERGQTSTWLIKSPLRKGFHAVSSAPLPF